MTTICFIKFIPAATKSIVIKYMLNTSTQNCTKIKLSRTELTNPVPSPPHMPSHTTPAHPPFHPTPSYPHDTTHHPPFHPHPIPHHTPPHSTLRVWVSLEHQVRRCPCQAAHAAGVGGVTYTQRQRLAHPRVVLLVHIVRVVPWGRAAENTNRRYSWRRSTPLDCWLLYLCYYIQYMEHFQLKTLIN